MNIKDLIDNNSIFVKRKKINLKASVIKNILLKSRDYSYSKHTKNISIIFGFLILIFCIIFITQLFNLQIINHEKYKLLSTNNYIRSEIIHPSRGLILDRKNNFLVTNVPKYVLNINLSKCMILRDKNFEKCQEEIRILREYLEFNKESIINDFGKKDIIPIKKEITKEEAILVGSIQNIPSIEISIIPQRNYLYPESFAHILGFVGLSDTKIGEYEGKGGVEEFYNSFLSGIPGSLMYKSDSLNTRLDTYTEISPISGKNIILSIDKDLQNFSYELLEKKIKSNPKMKGGVILAQNPKNGEILAMANYPSFDINKMTRGISQEDYKNLLENNKFPFLNRAISGVYPPGSVFKMVTASGILEESIAKPSDTIFDPGYIEIKGYRYKNWKLDGHGVVDLIRAIQVSNDTYFYIYSSGFEGRKSLGIEGIYRWGKKYRFGELTGVDLNGEAKGFMPDGRYKTWYLGDTFISAIGQGDVLSTPIQASALMSYFANNQKVYVPKIVKEIDNLKRKDKILYENLLSESTFKALKESLRAVNTFGGTAFPFFDMKSKHGFDSAGKTGTSEYLDAETKQYETHAWYSGFAPYEDAEIVVTVFLESGGSGSYDAAPIAREVMDFYFK